ncbi:MAG: hypothetical protein C0196_03530 [Dictyoglomus turgidum]|nr:MAG: hypothetical protein C0196_03530 [Dictyoglomus turgidum]
MFLGKYIKFTKSIVKRVLVILTVFYLKLGRHVFGWEFVTNFLAQTPLMFLIPIILSKFGAKVGQNVVIKNVIIDNPKNGFEKSENRFKCLYWEKCFFRFARRNNFGR